MVTKPGMYLIRSALWILIFVFASGSLTTYESLRGLTLISEGPIGYLFLSIIGVAGVFFVHDTLRFTEEVQGLRSLVPSEEGREGEVNVKK